MKLYEFSIVLDEKRDKDDDITEQAQIVVGVTAVLARDDAQAQILAARAIPEEHVDKLDRLTVVVRPF